MKKLALLNVDDLREALDKTCRWRGKSEGVQSRQVLALFEVLVDAVNRVIEEANGE